MNYQRVEVTAHKVTVHVLSAHKVTVHVLSAHKVTVHVLSSVNPRSDSLCTVICQPFEVTVHGVSAHEVTVHVLSAYGNSRTLRLYGNDSSCTVSLWA